MLLKWGVEEESAMATEACSPLTHFSTYQRGHGRCSWHGMCDLLQGRHAFCTFLRLYDTSLDTLVSPTGSSWRYLNVLRFLGMPSPSPCWDIIDVSASDAPGVPGAGPMSGPPRYPDPEAEEGAAFALGLPKGCEC